MQLRPSEGRIDTSSEAFGGWETLYSLICAMNIGQLCGVDSV